MFFVPAGLAALDYSAADLDRDGYLTAADLRILAEETSTRAGAWRGDVNADGRVDPGDVRALAAILLRGTGRSADSPAALEQLIKQLTGGSPPPGADDPPGPAGDKAGSVGVSSGPPPAPPGWETLERDLARNREQLKVERLQQSERPAQPPGPPSADGPPDLPEVQDGTSQTPDLPVERLTRLMSTLDRIIPWSAAMRNADWSVQGINGLRNRLVGDADSRAFRDLFAVAVGLDPDRLGLSEFPNPDLVGGGRPGDLVLCQQEGQRNPGPGRFYPRSQFAMDVERAQPGKPDISRRTGGRQTLEEVYRPVSPPVQGGDTGAELLDGEVPPVSDDPWLSQIMKDVRDPALFIRSTGGDERTGLKGRGQTLVNLFSPDSARVILRGDPATLGLDPSSTFVRNYLPLSEEILGNLADNGIIPRRRADEMIEGVRRIVAPPQAGAPGSLADGKVPPADFVWDDGAKGGYGVSDLMRARDAGFSDAEILAHWEASGLPIAADARQHVTAGTGPPLVLWTEASAEALKRGEMATFFYDAEGNKKIGLPENDSLIDYVVDEGPGR